jgi:formylglycine-generating enzyme required for sulfatase activity
MSYKPGEILLNKYRIERTLGQGAFGVVYLVTHLKLNALRAIKVLRWEDPGVGSTYYRMCRERFHLEAQLGEKLKNPYIVPVYDFEQDEETLILVMEYAAGGSLQTRIEGVRASKKPIPIAAALRIGVEVGRGLAAMHRLQIVHRDLKPGNILFDVEGHARVGDLGLAQTPYSRLSGGTSLAADHPGTSEYMAPEQRPGNKMALKPAADVYALGCVLFEVLTGEMRYFQKAGVRASSLREDVPEWLDNVVENLLSEEESKRPWDGVEAVEELRKAAEQVVWGEAQPKEGERAQAERQRRQEADRLEKERQEQKETRRMEEERCKAAAEDAAQRQKKEQMLVKAEKERRQKFADHEKEVEQIGKAQPKAADEENARRQLETWWSKDEENKGSKVIPPWVIGAGGGGVVLLIVVAIWVLLGDGGGKSKPITESVTTPSAEVDFMEANPSRLAPSPTFTVEPTATSAITPTFTAEPTVNSPATPTLAPGASLVSEKDGMELVYVPEGDFLMGSPEHDNLAESDEKPQRTVWLNSYWIDRAEVTNAHYSKCVAAGVCNTSEYADNNNYNGADKPVVGVDWNDARTYCEWAGRRLPTEAEWEKAATGTDGRVYPWGDKSPNAQLLNYNNNVGKTTDAGSYPIGASPYGALDMAGNVWEWVADWYDSGYYSISPVRNPTGPSSGNEHVIRGGYWKNNGLGVRTANRYGFTPDISYYGLGIRCAATP